MLQSIPDPFDSYGSHDTEDRLFSVLQPLSLLSENSSSTTSLHSQATSHIHPAWMPTEAPVGESGELKGTSSNSSINASHHDAWSENAAGSNSNIVDAKSDETLKSDLFDQGRSTCGSFFLPPPGFC
jgi:hypothetical protein